MSNYPPGVTGNEYQISGPDYEAEYDGELTCPTHGASLFELGHQGSRWLVCGECDWTFDLPSADEMADDIAIDRAERERDERDDA